jgi:hypothetical protein
MLQSIPGSPLWLWFAISASAVRSDLSVLPKGAGQNRVNQQETIPGYLPEVRERPGRLEKSTRKRSGHGMEETYRLINTSINRRGLALPAGAIQRSNGRHVFGNAG